MPVEIDITENAFYKDAVAKGEARGKARALLTILKDRFGDKAVSGSTRKKVLAASEADVDQWLRRAGSAPGLDDVFSS